jgi:hypothetical protein
MPASGSLSPRIVGRGDADHDGGCWRCARCANTGSCRWSPPGPAPRWPPPPCRPDTCRSCRPSGRCRSDAPACSPPRRAGDCRRNLPKRARSISDCGCSMRSRSKTAWPRYARRGRTASGRCRARCGRPPARRGRRRSLAVGEPHAAHLPGLDLDVLDPRSGSGSRRPAPRFRRAWFSPWSPA